MSTTLPGVTDQKSRYFGTPAYCDDFVDPGRGRLGLWVPPALTSLPELSLTTGTYVEHTLKENEIGRLDLLAYDYYEDCTLWYIIALVNKITDPFSMTAGTILKIPSLELVKRALAARKPT